MANNTSDDSKGMPASAKNPATKNATGVTQSMCSLFQSKTKNKIEMIQKKRVCTPIAKEKPCPILARFLQPYANDRERKAKTPQIIQLIICHILY